MSSPFSVTTKGQIWALSASISREDMKFMSDTAKIFYIRKLVALPV